MIPVYEDSLPLEKVLENLSLARDVARDKAKNEHREYTIWWVMSRGYVILPQGIRPRWLFASEEERIPAPLR